MRSAADLRAETARLVRLGLLMALAGTLQALEGFLPSPVPWFRLGLGNALILAALCRWGLRDGLWVGLGKVILGGLLSGRLFAPPILLSLGGTLAATAMMGLALRASPPLGFVGVSVLGAQAHALAQVALAGAVVVRTRAVWTLAPLLGLLAAIAGIVTGLVAHGLTRAIGDAESPAATDTIIPPPREETR